MMSTRSGRVRQSLIEPSPRSRKGISPSRSPARSRKSSPATRSSIQKSPSRKSPTRKSPARKTKNTASKSPSRPVKETETIKVSTPSKRQSLRSNVETKLSDIGDKELYRTTRSRLIEYSIGDLQSNATETNLIVDDHKNGFESRFTTFSDYNFRIRKPLEVPQRMSRRLQQFADSSDRRSISKSISERSQSISKSISKSIGTISDEENSEDELPRTKSTSVTRRLATPLRASVAKLVPVNKKFEFGGKMGPMLLITLIPLTVFFILMSCSKLCSHSHLQDLSKFKSISIWFNYESIVLLGAQYLIQALLVILPVFGQTNKDNDKGKKQCFNAFFSTILTTIILFSLNYIKKVNVDAIMKLYLSLAATSYIASVLVALFLYVKSRKIDSELINPYGNTGYFINDFFVGREIHSFIKKLNIKLWVSRVCNINTLILSILIFKYGFQVPTKDIQMLSLDNLKEFISKVQYKPTIVLYSMMQIMYILNYILKEHKITSTFYWQSEGLGYLQIVCSALYPFYFTSISKYIVDVELEMSTNALVAALTLFLLGFLIMLISNNVKHEFRKNPFHPNVTRLDSMPTFHGNKLLVSNLWGTLRHPNYTGDIIIHIAFALPGIISKKPIAALPAVLTVFVLLHRAWRDHNRCLQRYGSAWQRYCKRVPSVIIPKIL